MGPRKLLVAIALVFGLSGGLFGAAQARAHPLDLGPLNCAAGAASLEAALALPREALTCDPAGFDPHAPFVRTTASLDGLVPQDGAGAGSGLVWQTEAADFTALTLRFAYADGTVRQVEIDPRAATRRWFVGNRFSVPVPLAGAPLTAIDAVIEKPFTQSMATGARLMTQADRAAEHYHRSLGYVFLLGLLILPLLYDFLFYRVLRQSFVLWHIAMVTTTTAYILLQSGLVFEILPDLALGVRWRLTSLSLALAAASGAMLVAGLIEERFLPARLARVMMAVAFLPLAVKGVATVGGESLRIVVNDWFVFSFVPVVAMIGAVTAVALARGSRGARWAFASMAGLVVVMGLRILTALGAIELPMPMADMVFAGFVLLSLVTAVAVGDRFSGLKRDRDDAHVRAVKLGQMANTDGLTGLANRRAFDMIPRLKTGRALLVADIDHFKQVNDRHGHQVGDAVLCHVARVLRGALVGEPGGKVYRLGGEEFAVVADVLEGHELISLAERLREIVARRVGEGDDPDLPSVTMSLGAVLGHGQLMHEAFGAADRALYRAKSEGRNRVRMADGIAPSSETAPGRTVFEAGSG